MRIIFPLLVIGLCFGCRPEKLAINEEDVRITSIKAGGKSGEFLHRSFEYDQNGRITRVIESTDKVQPHTFATISYSGNQVLITYPPAINAEWEIRYTLDAAGRPLTRAEKQNFQLNSPPVLQRSYAIDSSFYEYNSDSLLTKVWGRKWDSAWTDQGYVATYVTLTDHSTSYTNTGKNVTAILKLSNHKFATTQGQVTVNSTRSDEEKHNYAYDMNFTNETDFKNAFLLSEFHLLSFPPYNLNRHYALSPNKITSDVTYRDGSGAVISSYTSTETRTLHYNAYGFISHIDYPGTDRGSLLLTYNK